MKNPVFRNDSYLVKQGGSWYYHEVFAAVSDDSESYGGYRSDHIGFRIFKTGKQR